MKNRSYQLLIAHLIVVAFTSSIFFRNIDNSGGRAFSDIFNRIDKYVLTPLGFFHRAWGMFPGPGSGGSVNRVTYFWQDGSVSYRYFFPRVASLIPSVWNEVMEDIMIRDDNNDYNGYIKSGYLQYNCHNQTKPLQRIEFQSSWVPLASSFAREPITEDNLVYKTDYSYQCS